MTRQNYYKARQARRCRENHDALVLALVRQEREVNPRAGTKKVLAAIRPELAAAGVRMGRNRLGRLLKRHGLLVEKHKSFRCRTTRQDPALVPSPNRVKDMELSAPGQAVASDITYVYTREGFLYLALMMDLFTREIIGYAVRETLETEGPLAALAMAGKALGGRRGVVAHSDRGCQYASHAYRARLEEMGWLSSMTEQLHCYENAKAERLNGTLKGEYGLDQPFKTKAAALPAIENAIWTYNHRRLHEKLGYKTPSQFREEWTERVA